MILVKFDFKEYYGRVESLIVCTKKDIKKQTGKTVYFGEVAGKHSEVSGKVEANMFEVLSEDKNLVTQMLSAFNKEYDGEPVTLMGISPFDYEEN